MAKISPDHQRVGYFALLAEKAERFDDMFEKMKEVARMGEALADTEKFMLAYGYKRVVASRRGPWRILSVIEQSVEPPDDVCVEYREKVGKEMTDIVKGCLSILEEHLIPSAPTPQDLMFYYKMKGDSYRYLAELKSGDDDEQEYAELSSEAYKAAINADEETPRTASIRLALALNLSVLHYESFSSTKRALLIAKKAFDEAMAELDGLSNEEARKETNAVLHVLQDNIRRWNAELLQDGIEVDVGNTTRVVFD